MNRVLREVKVNHENMLPPREEDQKLGAAGEARWREAAPSDAEKSMLSGVNKMARLGIG